jgi:hypothetical protein
MSLNRQLVNDDHVRRLVVSHDRAGWRVMEKQDSTVLRDVRGKNWQRVEREIRQFEKTAGELKQHGWIEH